DVERRTGVQEMGLGAVIGRRISVPRGCRGVVGRPMRRAVSRFVVAAAITLIPGMARQAHAAYDMSGRWLVVNSAPGAISPDHYEVVQDSGTLSITTWSPSGSGTAHGTIDEG